MTLRVNVFVSLFLGLSLCFGFALPALAESFFCASGFDETSFNGTWTNVGTYNGRNNYSKDSLVAYFPTNANGWYLGTYDHSEAPPPWYYSNISGSPSILDVSGGVWQLGGGSPSGVIFGTLVTGPCAGEGGGDFVVATSSATSTTAMLGSIAFELGILITMGFLMVIAFVYNSVTAKKPWLS